MIGRPNQRAGWLLACNVVGQLATAARDMYIAAVDAPPAVSSGLAIHSCAFRSLSAEGRAAIGAITVAVPMDSTQRDDLDPSRSLNLAVGHTNPSMERRFKSIQGFTPRVSITANPIAVPHPDTVFRDHFSQHPLVLKRNKPGADAWALRALAIREAVYIDHRGDKTPVDLAEAAVNPAIAAVVNPTVAKLNSDPETLLRMCSVVYGRALTHAFAHHLDDEAFYVMGADPEGGWREYVMEYGQVLRTPGDLAAFFDVTRRQAAPGPGPGPR
jgi:hypothetical protein